MIITLNAWSILNDFNFKNQFNEVPSSNSDKVMLNIMNIEY